MARNCIRVKALYELSEDTNFLNKKECIWDSVVLGNKVQELSEKHQLQSKLSLDSYYSQARSYNSKSIARSEY